MKKIKNIFAIITIFALSSCTLSPKNNESQSLSPLKSEAVSVESPDFYITAKLIESGKTYGVIMEENGVNSNTSLNIFNAAKDFYDLSQLKAGQNLYYTYNMKTSELLKLMYPISDEEELWIIKDSATTTPYGWTAERKKINYEIEQVTVKGEISSSLYESCLELGLEDETIIEFANIFEYSIDYAYDVRAGDSFKLVYEKRFLDGHYVMPGRILAGKFINNGNTYQAYYFEENEDNKGYFDEKGNALQKMFLRTPVAFKYISSGFTTGSRYISAFNISTGHRAIDYATPAGTPIRSVGDGTVTSAGWSRAGYGNLTTIRHNSTYSTNYAHQSKIIVKKGQRVKQGQVIGYVGSTGLSTGPHLHYEMVKNGVKINPLREVMPPGKPILEENKERFFKTIELLKIIMEK